MKDYNQFFNDLTFNPVSVTSTILLSVDHFSGIFMSLAREVFENCHLISIHYRTNYSPIIKIWC